MPSLSRKTLWERNLFTEARHAQNTGIAAILLRWDLRREFIHVGALSGLGLALPEWLAAQEAQAAANPNAQNRSFGRARACILLYLYGSPSQLETFDVKPDAPVGIRGDLGTTATALPGFRIGELLPETAKIVDRTTVVRSMSHPYPVHGIAYATSGLPDPAPAGAGLLEVSPRDQRHWPFMGSALDYVEERRGRGRPVDVPHNIALPFPLSTRRSNQPFRAGPYGGFLGAAYDPIWTDFQGVGTKTFVQENRGVRQEFRDPYAGIEPNCSFQISAAGTLNEQLTLDRLDRRRSLLQQMDEARAQFDAGAGEWPGPSTAIGPWRFRCSPPAGCGGRSTSAWSRCRCAKVTA